MSGGSDPKRLGFGKRLSFATVLAMLGAVAGLGLGEAILRIVWPSASVFRALPPGLRVRFHAPHIHGVQTPSVYQVNSMGVRGREWSERRESEYRILCLGGSTTQSLVTDDSRVWTTLLETRLGRLPDGRRTWVGNIGRAGLASAEHVLQMRHLLDVYDPDAVVLLVGINDLLHRLRAEPYEPYALNRPENQPYLWQRAFGVFPGSVPQDRSRNRWLERTRTWQLLLAARYKALNLPHTEDRDGRNLLRWRARRAAGRRAAVLPPLEPALEEYRRNLGLIVQRAQDRGVPIVLMTQPVLWRAGLTDTEKALLWLGGVGDFRRKRGSLYYEPEALAEGMDAYNRTLLEVCQSTGAQCVDLSARIPRTAEFFYDDCHFTDAAHPIIADAVADAVRRHPPAAPGPRAAKMR